MGPQLQGSRPLLQKSSFACPHTVCEARNRELESKMPTVVKGALTIDRIAAFTFCWRTLVDGVGEIGADFDANDFAVKTKLEDQ